MTPLPSRAGRPAPERQSRRSFGATGRRWHVGAGAVTILLVTAPAADASVIWEGGQSLPGTRTRPDGSIQWHNDSQQGRAIRFSVVERTGQNSERCEVAVARRQLADGMTVYLGWKSRVVAPSPGAWNGLLQLKAPRMRLWCSRTPGVTAGLDIVTQRQGWVSQVSSQPPTGQHG